jgi:hypothetical protein
MSVEEAKKVLRENGYPVGAMWNIADVQSKFNCSDIDAMGVLESALENEATMEQIWYAIDFHGEDEDLEKVKLSECCYAQIRHAVIDINGTDLDSDGTECSDCGAEYPNVVED